jgi:hypothetical protein
LFDVVVVCDHHRGGHPGGVAPATDGRLLSPSSGRAPHRRGRGAAPGGWRRGGGQGEGAGHAVNPLRSQQASIPGEREAPHGRRHHGGQAEADGGGLGCVGHTLGLGPVFKVAPFCQVAPGRRMGAGASTQVEACRSLFAAIPVAVTPATATSRATPTSMRLKARRMVERSCGSPRLIIVCPGALLAGDLRDGSALVDDRLAARRGESGQMG